MKYAKKLVLPPSTHRVDPVSNKLDGLESELNKILSNVSISTDEKVQLYQKILSDYLEYYQQKQLTSKQKTNTHDDLKTVQENIRETQKQLEKSQTDLHELYKHNTELAENSKNEQLQYEYPDEYTDYEDDYDDYDDYDEDKYVNAKSLKKKKKRNRSFYGTKTNYFDDWKSWSNYKLSQFQNKTNMVPKLMKKANSKSMEKLNQIGSNLFKVKNWKKY
jgi:hypothetical protein